MTVLDVCDILCFNPEAEKQTNYQETNYQHSRRRQPRAYKPSQPQPVQLQHIQPQPKPVQPQPVQQSLSNEKVAELTTIINSYKTAIDEINKHVDSLTKQNDYLQEAVENQQTEIEDLKVLVNILFNQDKLPKASQPEEVEETPKKKHNIMTQINKPLIVYNILIIILFIRSFF